MAPPLGLADLIFLALAYFNFSGENVPFERGAS
jgi:hypothetical protein